MFFQADSFSLYRLLQQKEQNLQPESRKKISSANQTTNRII
jgi:hypothetical protein